MYVALSLQVERLFSRSESMTSKCIIIGKSFVASGCVLTLVVILSYTFLIAQVKAMQTIFFSRAFHKTSFGTLLYALCKWMETMCKSLLFF